MTRVQNRDFGSSLSFTGSTANRASVPYTFPQDAFTVSFWIKQKNAMASGETIFSQAGSFAMFRQATNDVQVYAYLNAPGDFASPRRLRFRTFKVPGATGGGSTTDGFYSRWEHRVLVFYVSGTFAKCDEYVNGAKFGSTHTVDFTGDASTPSGNLLIGGDGVANASNSFMDRVQIFNTALSASDVADLYYKGVIARNPDAQWNLDEGAGTTVLDTSGNGNNGTITGAVYSSDVPSVNRSIVRGIGRSLRFNGTSDVVNGVTNSIVPVNSVTFSAWVNPSVIQDQRIVNLHNSSSITLTSTGIAQFVLYALWTVDSTIKVPKNTWTHICGTYDRVTAKIYVNGVLSGSAAHSDAFPVGSILTQIGAYSAAQFFGGNISEARIWKDVAFTSQQVKDLYYSGNFPRTGLAGEFLLNEGSGTVAIDSSGLGNNATITGALYVSDAPSPARTQAQDYKSSLNFNGTSDFVNIVNSGGQVFNNTDFSIEMKLKIKTSLTGTGYIFAHQSTATNNRLYLTCASVDRVINISMANAIGAAGIVLQFDRWYHIVGVFDRSTPAVYLYVDGVLVSSRNTGIGTPGSGLADMQIGGRAAGAEASAIKVVKTRTWAKQLTAKEVFDLYTNNIAPSLRPTLDLNFNEGAGTTALDSSGNANHGAITGAVYSADTQSKKRQLVNANLVQNGDFEYAPPFTAATTTPTTYINGTAAGASVVGENIFGWGIPTAAIAANASAKYDPSVSHSGSYSMKLSNADATGAITVGNFANNPPIAKEIIQVSPSTAYTFTGWIKTNNTTTNGAGIDVREYDGALGTVATNSTSRLSGTNDWTRVSISFTTGANTRYIGILLRHNVAGNISDAWFDDLDLRPTTPTARLTA